AGWRAGSTFQTLPLIQTRLPRDRRASRPPPDVRDLRLLAADGRHSPARGEGGPRRHSVVRPPRRLPHRNPRSHESAEREERGDRAEWIEGWSGREKPAVRPRRAP